MRELLGVTNLAIRYIKPEFIPKGETLGVEIEIYKNSKYGAVAYIYPWNRFREQLWGKRDRRFARMNKAEKQKEIKEGEKLRKRFENAKPVNTDDWIHPRIEDMKAVKACNIFFALITSDTNLHNMYMGRVGALNWATLHTAPPKSKRIGWTNCGIGVMSDGFERLDEVIDTMEGSAMSASKSTKFYMNKDGSLKRVKWYLKNPDEYKAHVAKLKKAMIQVRTNAKGD